MHFHFLLRPPGLAFSEAITKADFPVLEPRSGRKGEMTLSQASECRVKGGREDENSVLWNST